MSGKLTPEQEEQFRQYTAILLEWNKKTNITRITSLADILQYHYRDALYLDRFIDMHAIQSICDIGTFPACANAFGIANAGDVVNSDGAFIKKFEK